MALQKTQQTRFGINGTYWRIRVLTMDHKNLHAHITLDLYTSANNSVNVEPLQTRTYALSGDKYPFTIPALEETNAVALAYAAIKANDPFFADAQNV